jgi:hypothetical protein
MTITDVKLLEKQGGKSGHWVAGKWLQNCENTSRN